MCAYEKVSALHLQQRQEMVTPAKNLVSRVSDRNIEIRREGRCDAYFQCDKSESLIEMSYFHAVKK